MVSSGAAWHRGQESDSGPAGPDWRASSVPDLTKRPALPPRVPKAAGRELTGRRREEDTDAAGADLGLRQRMNGGVSKACLEFRNADPDLVLLALRGAPSAVCVCEFAPEDPSTGAQRQAVEPLEFLRRVCRRHGAVRMWGGACLVVRTA